MNTKKIVLGLSSILLLSSVAMADDYRYYPVPGCGMKMDKGYPRGGYIVGTIMHMDLSKEQRMQVKKTIQQHRQNRVKACDAFSETEFDKKRFIELSKQKRDNRIVRKAELIESLYAILTPQQKKEFKQLLEQRKTMRYDDR